MEIQIRKSSDCSGEIKESRRQACGLDVASSSHICPPHLPSPPHQLLSELRMKTSQIATFAAGGAVSSGPGHPLRGSQDIGSLLQLS